MSRTPIARWTPTYLQAWRLAWKPLVGYGIFVISGFAVFLIAMIMAMGSSMSELPRIFAACIAGLLGVFVGQAMSLARIKTLPIVAIGIGAWMLGFFVIVAVASGSVRSLDSGTSDVLFTLMTCAFFFCIALSSGLLSLQHRYELLASFWPTVGYIDGIIVMLMRDLRLNEWEHDKVKIWTPWTIALMAMYIVTLLIYLASKQTMRVELWQALSGATERRVSKRTTLSAVPRRNLLPLLLAGGLLLAFTAVLAPYLWRTKPNEGGGQQQSDDHGDGPSMPNVDGDALVRTLQEMAMGAKQALFHLWPLIFLLLFYRPIKRWLLQRHLRQPFFPTPPSERIEYLWEYVRIAAGDVGIAPGPADSVEELVVRIREAREVSPSLDQAAAIYARSRYGFVIEPGAAVQMKIHALAAAYELRAPMTTWERVKSGWRPLH